MADPKPPLSPKMLTALIMGLLVLWGVYVAVGTQLYGLSWRAAAVVLVCVGIFLGVWLVALRFQPRGRKQ
jgi:hypothetical protein